MEIKELAREAYTALHDWDFWCTKHGIEVAPGFFNLYNEVTGQSKMVLLHLESGMVFKSAYGHDTPDTNSRRLLGEVTWDGVTMPVRLPYFALVEPEEGFFVEVQEYVRGESCGDVNLCNHRADLKAVTGYFDCHIGNWKITPDGEVVLFDFDGIRL